MLFFVYSYLQLKCFDEDESADDLVGETMSLNVDESLLTLSEVSSNALILWEWINFCNICEDSSLVILIWCLNLWLWFGVIMFYGGFWTVNCDVWILLCIDVILFGKLLSDQYHVIWSTS